MRSLLVVISAASLVLVFGAAAPRGAPMSLRLHAETTRHTTEPFAFATTVGNPPVQVNLEKMPVITEREVEAFYPFVAADGNFGCYFQLDRHGSKAVEQVTSSPRTRFLVAFFNGRPVSRMRIDRPVRDGVLVVHEGILPEEIFRMGQRLPMIGESPGQTEQRRREDRLRMRGGGR